MIVVSYHLELVFLNSIRIEPLLSPPPFTLVQSTSPCLKYLLVDDIPLPVILQQTESIDLFDS